MLPRDAGRRRRRAGEPLSQHKRRRRAWAWGPPGRRCTCRRARRRERRCSARHRRLGCWLCPASAGNSAFPGRAPAANHSHRARRCVPITKIFTGFSSPCRCRRPSRRSRTSAGATLPWGNTILAAARVGAKINFAGLAVERSMEPRAHDQSLPVARGLTAATRFDVHVISQRSPRKRSYHPPW